MKESKLLASFQVPVLLIVPPLNRIALLLAAVLPLQVVLLTLIMRPSSISFRALPVMDRSPSNWVVAAPLMLPPVQVPSPVNVWLVPCRLPPLMSTGVLCVPPLTLTKVNDSEPLIFNVPLPAVVTLFRLWVPWLKSSVLPLAILKSPVWVPLPFSCIVPAFTLVVPVLL